MSKLLTLSGDGPSVSTLLAFSNMILGQASRMCGEGYHARSIPAVQ